MRITISFAANKESGQIEVTMNLGNARQKLVDRLTTAPHFTEHDWPALLWHSRKAKVAIRTALANGNGTGRPEQFTVHIVSGYHDKEGNYVKCVPTANL